VWDLQAGSGPRHCGISNYLVFGSDLKVGAAGSWAPLGRKGGCSPTEVLDPRSTTGISLLAYLPPALQPDVLLNYSAGSLDSLLPSSNHALALSAAVKLSFLVNGLVSLPMYLWPYQVGWDGVGGVVNGRAGGWVGRQRVDSR